MIELKSDVGKSNLINRSSNKISMDVAIPSN
jgi:hypothetical protein